MPPVSKSDAHRALVLAEICDGRHETWLPAAPPRDVEVLSRGLITVRARGGAIDCLDAGAPFRFLLSQAALTVDATFDFTGTARLAERPHAPLLEALASALGVRFEGTGWPLRLTTYGARATTAFAVSGAESSQFASSLLLGAARLVQRGSGPVAVIVHDVGASEGYFELTLRWLERFGFSVRRAGARVEVTAYAAQQVEPVLPGDWSSLTYLLPLGWVSGLEVASVDLNAHHPDRAFARHLQSAGLTIEQGRVHGALARGFDVDVSECPDAVPALVAMALAAPAPSTFTKTGVLRLKESDRLAGVVDLCRVVGADAVVDGERLRVTPVRVGQGGAFDARADHRLVMAAAVVGRLLGVPLEISDRDAVTKSFPAFWREAAKAGVR